MMNTCLIITVRIMQFHILGIKPDLQKPVVSCEMKITTLGADANVLARGSAGFSGLPCVAHS